MSNRNMSRINYVDLANTGTRTTPVNSDDLIFEPEVRQSQRIASNSPKNYAELNQGPKHLTIGNTEPSRHFVEYERDDDDLTITPIDYSQNHYHRGLKEAINIQEEWPCLNLDKGRTNLLPIYHNFLSRPSAKPKMSNLQNRPCMQQQLSPWTTTEVITCDSVAHCILYLIFYSVSRL